MKIMAFGDIHFHSIHRYSHITPNGFSVRENEHLLCADTLIDLYRKNNIDKVVFLGDMYGPVGDTISCQTQMAVTEFLKRITDVFKIDIIIGNHDISGQLNNQLAHKLYPFKYWNNINIYDSPTVEGDFIYMPHCYNFDSAEDLLNGVENKEDKIIFSHLELKDIPLADGIFTKKGVSLNTLKKFKMTLQGHFHSGGSYGKNIKIAGSTQRLSFKDPGLSRKNILIYDTVSNKITRESFNCPDWLVFNDDNINEILNVSNNNYIKVELTNDLLLTDEIKNKLDKFLAKDIHIDINRLTFDVMNDGVIGIDNKKSELEIIKEVVDKSEFEQTFKQDLILEGAKLLTKAKK